MDAVSSVADKVPLEMIWTWGGDGGEKDTCGGFMTEM